LHDHRPNFTNLGNPSASLSHPHDDADDHPVHDPDADPHGHVDAHTHDDVDGHPDPERHAALHPQPGVLLMVPKVWTIELRIL